MSRRLRLTIDGQICHAVLAEGPLAEQLATLCPFAAEFQCQGGHEYYTRLPQKLRQEGSPMTSKVRRNQITYFEGWNVLSLSFQDADIAPYTVAHVGMLEEDATDLLETAGGVISVRCDLETE